MKTGLAAAAGTTMTGCGRSVIRTSGRKSTRRKMIILGFDGMDPVRLEAMMAQGKLPSFRRLRAEGGYRRLRTSLPPQSPVAWSNFITGMDPGGHGIFDFIHRTPQDYVPYLSTSRVEESKKTLELGSYVIPLAGGDIELLRKGKAFWQILEEHDIPATIIQIPSNFPPAATKQRTLSGMGTPDVLGTYGIFNFYTTEATQLKPDIGGGRVHMVRVEDNQVEAELPGPRNSFRKDRPETAIPFKVFLDPENPLAKIVIDDREFILKEGEWSEFQHVSFPLIPTQSVRGICRFHLKQVRPQFKLYVSPVNLDPAAPALPISTPPGFSRELAGATGPFSTKGLPADTMAMDHGVLDDAEFLEQDEAVLQETLRLFEYELARFESGLWFHYFSSTDQRQHMFMRLTDPSHPSYDPAVAARLGDTIEKIYVRMDEVLGRVLAKADSNTVVMAMSDHGFTEFKRGFNLNSWLLQNGYMRIVDPFAREQAEFFSNTDWSGTRAYALGLNGLYVNLKGREGQGVVEAGNERNALIRELVQKLESVVDPETGEKVISKAYVSSEWYHGPMAAEAPDIIVGYNLGYRASWATPLGRMPLEILENNVQKWSGDHCTDPEFTPGILLTNRKVRIDRPALYDLTAAILGVFEIDPPPEMLGRNIF